MAKTKVHHQVRKQGVTDSDQLPSQILLIKLENGKRYAHTAACKYHITMASLQPDEKRLPHCACNLINEGKTPDARAGDKDKVTVIVEHDLKEYILCVLDQKRVQHCKLDLMVKPGEQIAFKALGNIPVELIGVSSEAI